MSFVVVIVVVEMGEVILKTTTPNLRREGKTLALKEKP